MWREQWGEVQGGVDNQGGTGIATRKRFFLRCSFFCVAVFFALRFFCVAVFVCDTWLEVGGPDL